MPDAPVYTGYQVAQSGQGEINGIAFIVKQLLSRVGTSTIVKVTAVTNAGGLEPVGFVDVVPQVNQKDGAGNTVPHGTIHGLPYSRLQGGTDAVILDPKVGDLGIAVFASRDISSVKAGKKQANPGSHRRFDMADGMYVGGLLNGTPTQYVRFSADGITICTPVQMILDAPAVLTTGNLIVSTGASGSFPTASGQIVTVLDGIVVNIF
jgi:hypothetical protein